MLKLRRDMDKRLLTTSVNALVGVLCLLLYRVFYSTFAGLMSVLFAGIVLGQIDSVIKDLRGK